MRTAVPCKAVKESASINVAQESSAALWYSDSRWSSQEVGDGLESSRDAGEKGWWA